MTNHKSSRMSVGMKRECSLVLKSIFLPSRMTSEEEALPDIRQNLFFLSPAPKSRLLMGSESHAIYHCSEVQAGSPACSLLCFLPSPHGKLFQAVASGVVHGHCHDEVNVASSDRNSKKTVSQILIDLDEERKEVTSCLHLVCCAQTSRAANTSCSLPVLFFESEGDL